MRFGASAPRRGTSAVGARRRAWRLALSAAIGSTLYPSAALPQEPDSVPADPVVAPDVRPDTIPSAADRARAMLDTLRLAADSVEALRAVRLSDPGVELDLLRLQALDQVGRMQTTLRGLADLMRETSPDSLPADSVRAFLRGYLGAHLEVIDAAFAETVADFDELRLRRATATPEEVGPLEIEIKDIRAWADTLLRYQEWALGAADRLQVDVGDRWERYDRFILTFAENSVGRLRIAVSERDQLREQLRAAERSDAPESEIEDLRRMLAAAETRIEAIAANLDSLSERLDRRGFESAVYREVLIRATGEVTGDVLDPQVLIRLARGLVVDSWRSLRRNAGTAFVRLLIIVALIVGFRVLFSLLWRLAGALHLVRGSQLVRDLVGRIIRPVATLVGLVFGLSVIGVQTTTLLAGLGVAGLVVGFALQDSLSNLFAGMAILASRPYDVDDIVEAAGVVGRVREMGLWNTTIVTFDARRLLVPNRNIWGSNVENRSAEVNRRVETVARIGYDTDLRQAIAVLERVLIEDPRVLEDPAPTVWVSRLADSWIEVKLWPWVRTEDWWEMHSDLPRLVRLGLADAGIEIPVPRRDVVTRAAPASDANRKAEAPDRA